MVPGSVVSAEFNCAEYLIMHIESLAKHVQLDLDMSYGLGTPQGELVVSSPTYTEPEIGGSGDLVMVVPAVIAVPGQLGDQFWGPQGLRVGTLVINQVPLYTPSPLTVRLGVIGVTFSNQLQDRRDITDEITPSSSSLFSGGQVSWGDGTSTDHFGDDFPEQEHVYAQPGEYNILLSLNFVVGNFAWSQSPVAARRYQVS